MNVLKWCLTCSNAQQMLVIIVIPLSSPPRQSLLAELGRRLTPTAYTLTLTLPSVSVCT